ncbi:MAG: hypothetical protein GY727_04080 [Gammaproteobacteria bacterium]|nr:hypothetical protein [Gammaproteobacteria bacterium]MCP4275396.1 hypothetical protein [Gammaproteobacteria bacterium]MCP4832284.1 hypothetical protein [Gammaproteobacteria bacterium]
MDTSLSDSLKKLWVTSDSQEICKNYLESDTNNSQQLIKKESRVRIFLSPADNSGNRSCQKLYRVPEHLQWRTWHLTSRAEREFKILHTAYKAGAPVIPPLKWAEMRRRGILHYNSLTTLFIEQRDMSNVLAELEADSPEYLSLLRGTGELLAHLHRAGILWMTALPRNILAAEKADEQHLAFDMPYGQVFTKSIHSRTPALYDIYMLIKYGLNQANFSTAQANKVLLAYCADSTTDPALLIKRLNKRTKARQFLYRLLYRSIAILR